MLPNLSRQHANGAAADFGMTLDWAMRLVVLIVMPATLGLMLLAGPLLATLFYGGRFGAGDVEMASFSLVPYAAGLLGFTMVKVLAPGYFARQITATPVRIGLIALGLNMVMNVVIVGPWVLMGWPGPHAGLAAATSLCAFINAGLLYRGLRREGVITPAPGWGRFLLRVGVASGVLVMALVQAVPPTSAWLEADFWTRCAWLAAAVLGGGCAYFAALFAAGFRLGHMRMQSRATTL
jgi:putative peptidoglycan lipid II flippase